MRRTIFLISIFLFSATSHFSQTQKITQGSLEAIGKDGPKGAFTLKHTEVKAEISGFVARVNVKQEFENPFNDPIEAVYTFPLSHAAAVDRMKMTIGSRVIRGKIMRREEARKVYEDAKEKGQAAALLDQERPNVFTQSVANIMPGEKIVIEISYVETLEYESGTYEFVFPMVVGPRYFPAGSSSDDVDKLSMGTGGSGKEKQIDPKIAEGRAGQDISIEVTLDAGVPIQGIKSQLHEIDTEMFGTGSARISLKTANEIPNKDFVLKYEVAGERIQDALITHRDSLGGFFTLILQPPEKLAAEDITPKEIVFVLDTSGSMGGFPIEKAKEAIGLSLRGLHPYDTFNVITFAGDTHILFPAPVPATPDNLDMAHEFINSRRGGGGTEMMKAIRAALAPTKSQEHVRVVCFLTDGYVGNEGEIINEVKRFKNARVFSFGIGNSVNRYLLAKIAEEGNGEAEFVMLGDDASEAARRFYERVRSPLLTDIRIDWSGMPVTEVYPSRIRDLFSARPVVLNGRFTTEAAGSIVLRGRVGGQHYERVIDVSFPDAEAGHDALSTLWARRKIEELRREDYDGVQNRDAEKDLAEKIASIGLEFGLMTEFTSFVAVEEKVVNRDGRIVTIDVPVDLAEGTFGGESRDPHGFIVQSWVGRTAGEKMAYSNPLPSGSLAISGNATNQRAKAENLVNTPAVINSLEVRPNRSSEASGTQSLAASGKKLPEDGPGVPAPLALNSIEPLPQGTTLQSLLGVYVAEPVEPNDEDPENSQGIEYFEVDLVDGNRYPVPGTVIAPQRDPGAPPLVAVRRVLKPLIPQAEFVPEGGIPVIVAIRSDATGSIVAAEAVDAEGPFAKAAESAAKGLVFTAASRNGKPLEFTGLVEFRFDNEFDVALTLLTLKASHPRWLTRRPLLRSKLHYWVYEAMVRFEDNSEEPAENESKFILGGRAHLTVFVSEQGAAVLNALQAAGLRIEGRGGRVYSGTIDPRKIGDLGMVRQVEMIYPGQPGKEEPQR